MDNLFNHLKYIIFNDIHSPKYENTCSHFNKPVTRHAAKPLHKSILKTNSWSKIFINKSEML